MRSIKEEYDKKILLEDYYKTCWLGISLDSNGDVVGYNDAHCDYSYNSYLCTAKEK